MLAGLVVAAAVIVVGLVAVILLPEVLALVLWSHIGAEPRTSRTDSLRDRILGVLTLGAVAAWVAQYRLAAMARLVDDYNGSVRQLSQGTWEQVAGIRDLEKIAMMGDVPLQRKTLQMLAIFVRDRAPRRDPLGSVSRAEDDKDRPTGKRRPEPAVQEALRVIGEHLPDWAPQPYRTKEDQRDARQDADDQADRGDLTGEAAEIPSQENYIGLADIAIDGAGLRSAKLTGLNLRRSLLRDAKLEHANLSYSKLRSAVLSDADLESATLEGSSLVGADLNHADLNRADLRRADMRRADLTNANLIRAKIEGAHLRGVVGLSQDLGKAIGTPHCLPADKQCRGHTSP